MTPQEDDGNVSKAKKNCLAIKNHYKVWDFQKQTLQAMCDLSLKMVSLYLRSSVGPKSKEERQERG